MSNDTDCSRTIMQIYITTSLLYTATVSLLSALVIQVLGGTKTTVIYLPLTNQMVR